MRKIKTLSKDEKILSMDKIFIRQKHPWVEKSYSWIKVSYMGKMMDNFFLSVDVIHRWKVQIKTRHDAYGRSLYLRQIPIKL